MGIHLNEFGEEINVSGGTGGGDYLPITGGTVRGNIALQGLTASHVPDVVNVGATFTPSVLGHYGYTASQDDAIYIEPPENGKTIFDLDVTVPAGTTSFAFSQYINWKGGTVSFTPGTTQELRFEYVGGTFQGGYRDPDLSQYPTKAGDNVFTGGNTFGTTTASQMIVGSNVTYAAGDESLAVGTGHNLRAGSYSLIGGKNCGWTNRHPCTIVYGEGLGSGSSHQAVFGKFNLSNTFSARVTGGGSSINNRKNIEVLDWDGNLTLSGDVIATISGSTVAMSELKSGLADVTQTIVDGGTASDVTVAISGGTKYKYATLSGLTFSTVADSEKEAVIIFTSGATATTLDTPSTVLWQGGELPSIEANMTYAISIQNNLAVCAGFAEVTE